MKKIQSNRCPRHHSNNEYILKKIMTGKCVQSTGNSCHITLVTRDRTQRGLCLMLVCSSSVYFLVQRDLFGFRNNYRNFVTYQKLSSETGVRYEEERKKEFQCVWERLTSNWLLGVGTNSYFLVGELNPD